MDERDLIEDMLGKQWHPFVILKEIIEKVPQYVYKIKKREKEGTLYYNCIVNYSLKSLYDLTMFKLNPEICKAFACNILDNEELIIRKKKKKTDEIKRLEKEAEEVKHGSSHLDQDCIDNVEDEKYRKFLIIVSDNSLLIFERPPFEKKEKTDTQIDIEQTELRQFTIGKLFLWGTITSIEQLKRNMEFKNKISIVWSKPVKNDDEFDFANEDDKEIDDKENDIEDPLEKVYETIVEVPNSDDFMMVVLEKMNKIKDSTTELKKKKILSVEVSRESIKNKDIKKIVHRINIFEKEYKEKGGEEIAQELMELYRKAIEYYSAFQDNKEYEVYLKKNHLLMMSLVDQ